MLHTCAYILVGQILIPTTGAFGGAFIADGITNWLQYRGKQGGGMAPRAKLAVETAQLG